MPCTFRGELSAELNTTDLRATTLPPIRRQMQSIQRHCKECPVPLLVGRQVQSRGQVQCGRAIARPASDYCTGQMGMERRLPGSLDASQKQSRLQHSKNLSSIITVEFYINGNFQLSHSSVSMRGPGTGGISQRRTQQYCGRTGPPGMTPTTTQRGCMGSLHAKTSSQQRACLPAAAQGDALS